MILADSDVLIEIVEKNSTKGDEAAKRILESGEQLCTSTINIHEVLFGLHKCGKPVKDLFQLPTLDFTKRDALLSSELELEAERSGCPVLRTDAMIAAIVINNSLQLYTFNLKHFSKFETKGLEFFSK
jgi:tRNA(fMet)-specific endonuclease VapC